MPLSFRRECVGFDVSGRFVDGEWCPRFQSFQRLVVQRHPAAHLWAGVVETLGRGFARGTKVRLRGLTGAPELNGAVGVLQEYDAASQRWRVELEARPHADASKRVRPTNLEHLVEPSGADSAALAAICTPLDVAFSGEPAEGPGVLREFLTLALRAALDDGSGEDDLLEGLEEDESSGLVSTSAPKPTETEATLGPDSVVTRAATWDYSTELRTFWFGEPTGDRDAPAPAYRACGALLGHAILYAGLLPPVFPSVLYNLLLRALGSPLARPWTLLDLARVSPHMASGLESLLEYDGDDASDVFPLDWPRAPELATLPPSGRAGYVQGYVEWYFDERFGPQARPFCEGFAAVVGHSRLLRTLVDAEQLEQIICGLELPLDVAAVRQGAKATGWAEEEEPYLDDFWEVVRGLSVDERRRFAVFVSASSRVPLKGWSDFRLQVQKNGDSDDRLPTAYTCFMLLLLPHYSSKEVLHARLLQAIQETQGFGLQ